MPFPPPCTASAGPILDRDNQLARNLLNTPAAFGFHKNVSVGAADSATQGTAIDERDLGVRRTWPPRKNRRNFRNCNSGLHNLTPAEAYDEGATYTNGKAHQKQTSDHVRHQPRRWAALPLRPEFGEFGNALNTAVETLGVAHPTNEAGGCEGIARVKEQWIDDEAIAL